MSTDSWPALAALLCSGGFISIAQAQQAETLTQIEVSPPAGAPKQNPKPKPSKQSHAKPKPAPASEPAAAASSSINDEASSVVEVNTIVGASTSVITADDIKRSNTNVFSTPYYDYGVASASTPGVITIYPLPGRVYTLKAGATF